MGGGRRHREYLIYLHNIYVHTPCLRVYILSVRRNEIYYVIYVPMENHVHTHTHSHPHPHQHPHTHTHTHVHTHTHGHAKQYYLFDSGAACLGVGTRAQFAHFVDGATLTTPREALN